MSGGCGHSEEKGEASPMATAGGEEYLRPRCEQPRVELSSGSKQIPAIITHHKPSLILTTITFMEESLIPSLSGGVVGSRFVTQDEVETAKIRREEQWKAAYARFVNHSAWGASTS